MNPDNYPKTVKCLKVVSNTIVVFIGVAALSILFTPIAWFIAPDFLANEVVENKESMEWVNKNLNSRGFSLLDYKVKRLNHFIPLFNKVEVTRSGVVYVNYNPSEEELKTIAFNLIDIRESGEDCSLLKKVNLTRRTSVSDAEKAKTEGMTKYYYSFGVNWEIGTSYLLPLVDYSRKEHLTYNEVNLRFDEFLAQSELDRNLRLNPDLVFAESVKGKVICPTRKLAELLNIVSRTK